jgi:DNA repair protein RAD50
MELEQCDAQHGELLSQIEICRQVISSIDKEVNESGATISNLRDNIIVQKLNLDIARIQSEIDSNDMEEAAKARRNYDDKYIPAKRREDKLSEVVCLPFHTPHGRSNHSLVPSTNWRAWRPEGPVEDP